eukprot:531377-Pelagomonas_calceolata.AAC.2
MRRTELIIAMWPLHRAGVCTHAKNRATNTCEMHGAVACMRIQNSAELTCVTTACCRGPAAWRPGLVGAEARSTAATCICRA